MASKKSGDSRLTPEYIEKIRVKPEDTAARLAALPYTITPRPEEKAPRGKLWCPYDAAWHKFPIRNSLPRCENCGISTEDYHVKTHNKLWGDSVEKRN